MRLLGGQWRDGLKKHQVNCVCMHHLAATKVRSTAWVCFMWPLRVRKVFGRA